MPYSVGLKMCGGKRIYGEYAGELDLVIPIAV